MNEEENYEKEQKKQEKKNKLLLAQEESTRNMEAAAIRLENANAEFKANQALAKQQAREALMQGQAEAGEENKKTEETPQEYAKRVMRGEY